MAIPISQAKNECLSARRPAPPLMKRGDFDYKRMYYQYRYPVQGKNGNIVEEVKEPLFEMVCKATTKFSKKGNKPKLNCYDVKPEDLLGISELDKGRFRCIQQYSADLDWPDFDCESEKDTKKLKRTFFIPIDEQTKQPNGMPAIVSLKIDTYGKSKFHYPVAYDETTGQAKYQSVPWEQIMNKNLDVHVVWSFNNEYKAKDNTPPSIQVTVRSCIILGISEKGEIDPTEQIGAQEYLTAHPELIDSLATQMERHRNTEVSLLTAGGEKATVGMEIVPGGPVIQMQNQNQGPMQNQGQMQGQYANQMGGQQMGMQGQYSQMPNQGQMQGQMGGQQMGMQGQYTQMSNQGMQGQMGGQTQMPYPPHGQMPSIPAQSQLPGMSSGFPVPGVTPNYGQAADLSSFLQNGAQVQRM